ncbi:MAG: ABC transporter permease [Candidatus Methylacidiphilales bacterium]|nr:ABC transporter permease [Candidatus Methylacidiphilales bacterium]
MKLLWRQFTGELTKLFSRKRTYIGFGAFLATEIAILGLLQLPSAQRAIARTLEGSGFLFQDYYSGMTLAFLMMTNTIFFLGSLYLSLIAGDVVAKEVEDGTLRMILSRPVSRLRVIGVKFAACAVYTAVLMVFITTTSLIVGVAYEGMGNLFVYAPLQGVFGLFGPGEALWRYALATGLLSYLTLTITVMAFCFSCFNMKPAAASIVALTLLFLDMVLQLMPFFSSIHGWLLTYHMSVWVHLFDPHIDAWRILESVFYLGGINASFLFIGALQFCGRDFKA